MRSSAPPPSPERLEFLGWLLFVVCAVLFLGAGLRDGDLLVVTASVVFLAACVLFLIPHLRRGGQVGAADAEADPFRSDGR